MAQVQFPFDDLKELVDIRKEHAVETLSMLGFPTEIMEDGGLNVEVTPNRPDALCVEGIARAVVPVGVQAAVEMSPIGRVARGAGLLRQAAPYVKGAVGGLLGYESNVALGLEGQSTREVVKAAALPAAARGVAGLV